MQTRRLGEQQEQRRRLARKDEAHVAPLNAWAASLRAPGRVVPLFDPDDGGALAQALLLLESPGPAVSGTEFISMDNPDGTAENMRCLIHLSGLQRREIALWNVVPWQLSAGGVVTPDATHHQDAVPATRQLLTLLPHLEAVILVGKHAQKAWAGMGSDLQSFAMPHPSPQNFNTRRQAAAEALSTLVEVKRHLKATP